MIVIGIDTATSSTTVGLSIGDGSTLERRDDPLAGAHPGHATRLLAMAEELLGEAAIGWSQLERIVVGAGPGTFTGLRVGIATARGLAQSLSIPLVSVSSLRVLACAALAEEEKALSASDGVLAVIDARRREVFAAAFGGDGRELSEPRALKPGDLADVLVEADIGDVSWLGIGDGALRYREQLEQLGVHVGDEDSALHKVSASVLCELGARSTEAPADYQRVLPDYLRRPDAELTLESDGAKR